MAHKSRNSEPTPNRLRGPRVAAVASVLAVGGLALTGCGPTGDVAPTPSPSEIKVDRPAVVERLGSIESLIDYAETLRLDQLSYVDYWREIYAADYEFIYGGTEYYTIYTEANANNSDREIVDNLNHMVQLAHMTPENNDFGVDYDAPFDANLGKKVVSGVVNDMNPGSGFTKFINESQDLWNGNTAASASQSPYFEMVNPDFTGSNFPCVDAVTQTEEVCRSIDVTENGETGSLRVILTPYKDAITGGNEFIWLAEER